MKTAKGLTVVELLVSAAVFGILMTAALSFFITTNRSTSDQSRQSEASVTTRLAFLRLSELIGQSAYIYPAGQTLVANGITYQTGPDALAVLLAKGTTYCPGATNAYCGVIFSVEARTPFEAVLGANSASSGFVLVERKFYAETTATGLTWLKDTLPTKTWSGTPTSTGILADSVDPANTSLGAQADLEFGSGSGYDRAGTFLTLKDKAATGATPSDSRALIQSTNATLALVYTTKRPVTTQETGFLLANAVPRAMPPNP